MSNEKLNSTWRNMTIGLVIGAGMGVLMSILAGNDVFLAVGIAIGAGIGATYEQTEKGNGH